MTATEHAEAILKAAFETLPMEHVDGAVLAAVEAAMQDARAEEHTPPSDDLRAAMEALRPYTSGPWHLKVVGDVLAAWDAQQGERS